MKRIKLPESIGDKYYKKNGIKATEIINGKKITGIIRIEEPDFDIALVRQEHYYGQIDYYLEIEQMYQ